MKLAFLTGSLAAAIIMLVGSAANAELNDVQYISTASGGVGGPDGVVGVDGAIEGNMTGVGAVTLLDKDGGDMWNGGDDFIYLFDNNRVKGSFTAIVRVVSQTEAIDGRWGKGGIRASRDLSASSAFAMAQVAAGNGSQTGGANPIAVRMAGRTTHGATINPGETGGMFEDDIEGSPTNVFASTGVTPTWLRLNYTESTNTFTSQWAPDAAGAPGVWSDPLLSSNSDVPVGDDGLYVGLAYSAHDDLNFDQVTRSDGLHGIVFDNYSFVPEPSSMVLIGLGLTGLAGLRRRRR